MDLTDEQWKTVETILPQDAVRDDGRGRPWSDRRTVLNGVLWILTHRRTLEGPAATIRAVPDRAPAFPNWVKSGVMEHLLITLAQHLKDAGGLDLKDVLWTDVCAGQKRGRLVGKTKRGKGTKIMGIADRHGLLSPCGQKALRPAEVKLVTCDLGSAGRR